MKETECGGNVWVGSHTHTEEQESGKRKGRREICWEREVKIE